MQIEIGKLRLFPLNGDGNVKAYASVELKSGGDSLYLTGFKIIEGQNGIFVGCPSRKDSSGEFTDIFFYNHPKENQIKKMIDDAILHDFNGQKNSNYHGGHQESEYNQTPPQDEDLPF